MDGATGQTLPGATVLTERSADSLRLGTATDLDGAFRLALADGEYTLRVSFVGYQPLQREIRIAGAPLDLGRLTLGADTTLLGDAQVRATRTRVEIRGDTTAYNAEAYAVNPDATAADLVRQLPGVTDGDGALRASGEVVQRVLVDGKEFFEGDQEAALDALPADAIAEVQVFDKASDQEELTGFDDGETEQTINLVTKPERRQSWFGRARIGGGSGTRYATETKVNRFDGDRRATLTIRSDNVDSQTRSALSEGGGQTLFPFGPTTINRPGITRSTSIGLSLNDSWGEWAEVSASYSFNGSDRENEAFLDREYLLSDAAGQTYAETSDAERGNERHTVNGRAEVQLGERTELRFDPRLTLSANDSESGLAARTNQPGGALLSRSLTSTSSNDWRLDGSFRGTLRHGFAREGRSLSGSLRAQTGDRESETLEDIEREFRLTAESVRDSLDQFGRRTDDAWRSRDLRGDLVYTEPLVKAVQVMLGYEPSVSTQTTDRLGRRVDDLGAYTIPDPSVTADSDRQFVQHEGGVGLQRKTDALTATIGFGLRHERLAFEQRGANAFAVDRAETTFAPYARIKFDLGERSSVDLNYNTTTRAPSASQLRSVVDDSNPIRLSSGNPDLQTERSHRMFGRFRTANPEAGTSFSVNGNLSVSERTIVPARFTAGADSARVRGVTLAPGAQFTYPVNAGRSFGAFGFGVYSRPLAPLKSNLNLVVNVSYSHAPTRFNAVETTVQSLWSSANVSLSTSGIETLDLSASYGLNLTAAFSDAPVGPRTLLHTGRLSADWRPGSGLVLTTTAIGNADPQRTREPFAGRIDLGIGYTFLANDEAQVRLTVSDVLDGRATVVRRVTDQFVEEREALALGRFALLSLSYTLRQ